MSAPGPGGAARVCGQEGKMAEAVRDHWVVAAAVLVLVVAVVAWWRAR